MFGLLYLRVFLSSQLLAPATEALSNPCLTGVITEYPWAQGIALMSVFSLFFVELLAMRYATFSTMSSDMQTEAVAAAESDRRMAKAAEAAREKDGGPSSSSSSPDVQSSSVATTSATTVPAAVSDRLNDEIEGAARHVENYAACLTSIFILEFGVIFHSVLIGLTLAVSGAEFKTLYIVLTFHQMFEGLGLGTRLATVPWPASRWQTPYLMAIAYGLSTPIAIAAGLGVRNSYHAEGATTLVVAGVFDSLSAGILLYTGLVELMAHEFLFAKSLKETKTSTLMSAFGCMVLGAFLMSLLGKWA